MQTGEILISMVRDGALIARNPAIGTFLLKANAVAKFVSAPISGLTVQYLLGRDLISATSTTHEGIEIYLLTAEGRRHARNSARERELESIDTAIALPALITAGS
jgi:hypothetical protein